MSLSYRAPKNANDIQASVYENTENLPRIDKPGVRQDRPNHKNMANRKIGQSCPSRTYTEKPKPEECCPFRISLKLDPGKCWFLSPWSGCRCHKFHPKFSSRHKRRRMGTCTDKERNNAALYAQHGSAGVAAGICREQLGNHFSKTQIRHNKVTTEIQTGQVPARGPNDGPGRGSSAEQFIQFLDKGRQTGDKSFVAIYHCVSPTVLVTLFKDKKKKKKSAGKKKQCDQPSAADSEEQKESKPAVDRHGSDSNDQGHVDLPPSVDPEEKNGSDSNDQGLVVEVESCDGVGSKNITSITLSSDEELQVRESSAFLNCSLKC
jgi:hypothetical protein